MDATDETLFCIICSRELVGDPDDQPDWPGGPMCSDCFQSRETDNDIWASEVEDDGDA